MNPLHTFFTHVLWTLQSHYENPSIRLQGLKSDLPMEHVMYVVFDVSFFRQPSPVDKLLFLPSRLTSKTSDAAMLISSEAGYLHWWALFGAKHEVGESLSHSCLSETWKEKYDFSNWIHS